MMRLSTVLCVVVLTAVLPAGGCARNDAVDAAGAAKGPASVAAVPGEPGIHRVRLTADATRRIGLTTATVRLDAAGRLTVAAAAVLYDEHGRTWVWTQVAPLTYQRTRVAVLRVSGATAVLTAGPTVGSLVVTLGAQELRGTEEGVPGEQ